MKRIDPKQRVTGPRRWFWRQDGESLTDGPKVGPPACDCTGRLRRYELTEVHARRAGSSTGARRGERVGARLAGRLRRDQILEQRVDKIVGHEQR